MLEVGNLGPQAAQTPAPAEHDAASVSSFVEDRSHFSAWAITSSPLVLSADLANRTTLERMWVVISNAEVIAVNQAWAGEAGRLVRTLPALGSGSFNNTAKNGSYEPGSYVWAVDCAAPPALAADGASGTPALSLAWSFNTTSGQLRASNGLCLDREVDHPPSTMTAKPCVANTGTGAGLSQRWRFSGAHATGMLQQPQTVHGLAVTQCTALSGSISTILTILSWISAGIYMCGALSSPVCA